SLLHGHDKTFTSMNFSWAPRAKCKGYSNMIETYVKAATFSCGPYFLEFLARVPHSSAGSRDPNAWCMPAIRHRPLVLRHNAMPSPRNGPSAERVVSLYANQIASPTR